MIPTTTDAMGALLGCGARVLYPDGVLLRHGTIRAVDGNQVEVERDGDKLPVVRLGVDVLMLAPARLQGMVA